MFAAKTKPCSSGQSRGSRNPLRDAIARLPPLGIPRLQAGEDVKEVDISSLAGKAVKFTIAGNTSQTSAAGLVHLV